MVKRHCVSNKDPMCQRQESGALSLHSRGHSPVRASLLLPLGKDKCLGMGPELDPHCECRPNSVRLQRRAAFIIIQYSAGHLFTHACIKVPVKSAFVSVFTHVSASTCSGAACSGGHIASHEDRPCCTKPHAIAF